MTVPDEPQQGTTRTLATGRDMLAPGTVLAGRYRVDGVGGVGGMGVVYRARDLRLDTDIALKLLHPERNDDASLARLHRELLLARRVSHPNVVRLHDVGQDGAVVFLTMDLVPASTLRDALADGPMPPERAIAIARQLAAALGAVHEVGIVHRDLKPANVLLDDAGKAWLGDFGIARGGDDALTREGELVGTLDYLSPEQVRGDAVGPASDVYALGLILWEMLTGEVPMRGATRDETLARRAGGRLPARLPGARGVPRGVEAIVRRCLSPDPADRYTDAAVLDADLARGSRRVTVARTARRAVAIGVVAVLAVIAWTVWPPAVPPSAQSAPAALRAAVLPFTNATGDPAFDWVQRALAEQVAIRLSGNTGVETVDGLRVFRAFADLRLDADALDPRALAELTELFNADALVRGRLIGGADGMRLQFVLSHRGASSPVRYDEAVTAASVLGVADRMVARVLDDLQAPRTGPPEAVRMSDDQQALAAFDDGVGQLARGERAAAVAAFEAATAADPGFGLAWLRLADAYRDAGYYDRAVDASERARSLLQPDGGRFALQARAQYAALSGDGASALQLLEDVARAYPDDMDAKLAYGEALGDAGRFDEAAAQLQAVADADPQHPRVWFLLGKFAILSGEPRRAADEWLVRALVVQNRFGTDAGRGEVLNALGIAHEHLGVLDVAAAHYRESARLRGAAGDRRGEAGSLANLARVGMIAGDIGGARETLARALALRESIGDLPGVADLRNESGVLEEEAGDYGAALAQYREALRLRTEVGDARGAAESQANIAFVHLVRGEYDDAAAFAERARAAYAATGDADGRAMAELTLAQLGVARGDWDSARALALDALARGRQVGNPFAEAAAEGLIGQMSRLQGRYAAALAAYGRALEIVEALGDTRGLVEFRLQRALLWLDLARLDAAGDDVAAARAALGDGGSVAQRALLARVTGLLAAARGDDTAAGASLAAARALALDAGSAADALEAALAAATLAGAPVEAFASLADDAARLGNRPLRLEVLAALATAQLRERRFDAARATVRDASRPPLALTQWRSNWRLHWLGARIERATDTDDSGALAEALRLFDTQWEGLPDALRAARDSHPDRERMQDEMAQRD